MGMASASLSWSAILHALILINHPLALCADHWLPLVCDLPRGPHGRPRVPRIGGCNAGRGIWPSLPGKPASWGWLRNAA
jgi:hypothetical protein